MSAVAARELDLAVSAIRPRPGNRPARRVAELAESIRDGGLINAVLVRLDPVGKGPSRTEYELIGGERRWRAHQHLGLQTIRARVYEGTSEADAEELGEIDNLQRDDLTPIEEGEAYERLLESCGTTAELARRVGRTETHVRQRMRLANLVDAIRVLVDDETLDIGAAEVIAQQHPDIQAKVAPYFVRAAKDGRISRLDVIELLEGYVHDISRAPFDTSDAALVEGAPACGQCPKRTGTQGTLLEVVDAADRCLDGACWDRKTGASAEVKLADAKKRGLTVLSKAQAKSSLLPDGRTMHNSEYVGTHESIWTGGANVKVGAVITADTPRVVAVAEDGRVIDLVKRSTAESAARAQEKAKAPPAKKGSKKGESDHQREERERREKVALQKRTRDLVLADVRGRIEQGKVDEELVLRLAIEAQRGAKAETVAKARGHASLEASLFVILEGAAHAPVVKHRRLLALLAELAIVDEVPVGPWTTDQKGTPPALALLGIDLVAMRRAAAVAVAVGKTPKVAKSKPAKSSKPAAPAKPAKKGKR